MTDDENERRRRGDADANMADEALQRRRDRRATRAAAGFVSGIVIATGAAMAVGAELAHRPQSGSTPIVVAAPLDIASDATAGPVGTSHSQVAQATVRGHGAVALADPGNGILDTTADQDAPEDESLGNTADIHTFESVYDLVEDHYVDTLPGDSKMARGAARNMVASLRDPYSYFLEPDQRSLFDAQSRGEFQGIGAITVPYGYPQEGYTEYRIRLYPLDGSPAQRAGLRSGDIVTHIDGKWVLGSDPYLKVEALVEKHNPDDEQVYRKEYDAANKRVLGGVALWQAMLTLNTGVGDKHTLTVQRPGVATPISVDVTSSELAVDPVSVHNAADGKATVIRVALLTHGAAASVRSALDKVPAGEGVVLDLRDDPGGISSRAVPAAQEVEAALLGGNRDFAVETARGGRRIRLTSTLATDEADAPGAATSTGAAAHPIAVLVNTGTFGATEALAEALAENADATLVGERTAGNARYSTLYSLRDGSGFILTTGKLVSPHGIDWQVAGGLSPRIAVPGTATDDEFVARAESAFSLRPAVAAAASREPVARAGSALAAQP
jgi:carboxyl-terminal processing protease